MRASYRSDLRLLRSCALPLNLRIAGFSTAGESYNSRSEMIPRSDQKSTLNCSLSAEIISI